MDLFQTAIVVLMTLIVLLIGYGLGHLTSTREAKMTETNKNDTNQPTKII